ncbi:MAG: hypothetical protein GW917_02760 [Bdellovibrionales bacterium]|nr:hypothetical protein [Bdellovibrionales bacterium]
MAAKKKTKKKTVAKKSKTAKAAKTAKKASKPAKATAKVTSKKKATAKKAKAAPAKTSKKKAESKKVKPVKAAVKKTSNKVASKPEPRKAAPKKEAAPKVPKPTKTSAKKGKAPRSEDVTEKPSIKEIEKVLAVKAPEAVDVQDVEVVLTDSDGNRYCRVKDCDQLASVDAYCRYHYLLFWKKIQIRKKILTEGKLEKYIEELTARYPDKYLDMLRKDLRSEKEFLAAIQELEIDENADDNMDEEDSQSFIEEVRGVSDSGGRRDDDY